MKKIKYNNSTTYSPVNLKEYILTIENNKNVALLHFNNETNKVLKSLVFEIVQYNKDDKVVNKSLYQIDSINIQKNNSYYYNKKVVLIDDFSRLEYKLIKAVFNNNVWENFQWQQLDNNSAEMKPDVAVKVVSYRVRKVLYPFYLLALFLGFIVLFIGLNYNKIQGEFDELATFDTVILQNGKIAITGYNGSDRHVIIPNIINGSEVMEISSYAFYNSFITSVHIMASNINIKPFAFMESPYLNSVTGGSVESINQSAFYNLRLLNEVDFYSIQTLETNSFVNTPLLLNLGTELSDINNYEFGALKSGGFRKHYIDSDTEIYKGFIVAVYNSNSDTIYLNSKTKILGIEDNLLESINTIVINDGEFKLTIAFLDMFKGKNFILNSKVKVAEDIAEYIHAKHLDISFK